jgi:hypothetical protein
VPAILRQKKKYPNLPAQIMLKKWNKGEWREMGVSFWNFLVMEN